MGLRILRNSHQKLKSRCFANFSEVETMYMLFAGKSGMVVLAIHLLVYGIGIQSGLQMMVMDGWVNRTAIIYRSQVKSFGIICKESISLGFILSCKMKPAGF